MSEHKARLTWKRGEAEFSYKTYSRNHEWRFENGHALTASAAAQFLGDPDQVDPEAAYVASLSSCHMLTFLAICALKGIVVEHYTDDAVGYLEKNRDGKLVITRVELHPVVIFQDPSVVGRKQLQELHHKSHHDCFLANSVKTEITTILD